MNEQQGEDLEPTVIVLMAIIGCAIICALICAIAVSL